DETVTVEFRARHAGGGWVWVEVRGRNFLTNEHIEGVMVDVRDISARKQQEVELELERDRAKALFEELGEPVVEVSFDGTEAIIERMNDTFMATFGLDESAVGDSLDEEIVPEEAATQARDINRHVEEGSVTEHEVERETADGLRTFLLRTVPFSVGGGSRAHAIYIDITDRKDYERELERQNERLERVSSVISHDLRNPLSVAKGYLELAREEHDSDALAYVEEAHERMDAIIEDTLTLARQGHRAVSLESIALADIVERCWTMVDTADATIEVDDDVRFLGDDERLPHLFENLFRNAVEHGGEDVTIRIGAIPDGIYIEDDGPGIDPSAREDVFEPGHSTSSGGTGFGLAIVKEIADAHGWDITITDGSDGGARFEITGLVLAPRSSTA
ncbi:MAG: ATP-binding protein, partial [Halobacteriota archaeon]